MSTPNFILKQLFLTNWVIFQHQTINFHPHFNAIVGETGSGKSLILLALETVLGGKADRRMIRKGAELACIEAVFTCHNSEVKRYFDEAGFPFDHDEIVIKRLIHTNAPSKNFVNFQLCPLATILEISRRFVDVVGQFENQKLLTSPYQLTLLDQFAQLGPAKQNYRTHYNRYQTLKQELETLKTNIAQRNQQQEFLKFQKDKIDQVGPSEAEEAELIQQKSHYLNSQNTKNVLSELMEVIVDSPANISNQLKRVLQLINHHPHVLSEDLRETVNLLDDKLQEVSFALAKQMQALEDEIEDIEQIMHRLDQYQSLKEYFRLPLAQIIQLAAQIEEQLSQLQCSDEQMAALHEQVQCAHHEAYQLALQLHQQRMHSAEQLAQQLTDKVRKLQMSDASIQFSLKASESDLTIHGITTAEVLAETNPQEGFFRIKEIASGGELSRILLAFREIISSKDSISIFLFDEIDTGIGGKTAVAIGKSLKTVSMNSQVIAITHLPQIAHYADLILNVTKELSEHSQGRSQSLVAELTGAEKKRVIEQMRVVE